MVPPFDIFRLSRAGPIWCGTAPDLNAAKLQAITRAEENPAAFIVLSLKTSNAVVIAPDGSTSTIFHLNT
jgi:hypothetical protein